MKKGKFKLEKLELEKMYRWEKIDGDNYEIIYVIKAGGIYWAKMNTVLDQSNIERFEKECSEFDVNEYNIDNFISEMKMMKQIN